MAWEPTVEQLASIKRGGSAIDVFGSTAAWNAWIRVPENWARYQATPWQTWPGFLMEAPELGEARAKAAATESAEIARLEGMLQQLKTAVVEVPAPAAPVADPMYAADLAMGEFIAPPAQPRLRQQLSSENDLMIVLLLLALLGGGRWRS